MELKIKSSISSNKTSNNHKTNNKHKAISRLNPENMWCVRNILIETSDRTGRRN